MLGMLSASNSFPFCRAQLWCSRREHTPTWIWIAISILRYICWNFIENWLIYFANNQLKIIMAIQNCRVTNDSNKTTSQHLITSKFMYALTYARMRKVSDAKVNGIQRGNYNALLCELAYCYDDDDARCHGCHPIHYFRSWTQTWIHFIICILPWTSQCKCKINSTIMLPSTISIDCSSQNRQRQKQHESLQCHHNAIAK